VSLVHSTGVVHGPVIAEGCLTPRAWRTSFVIGPRPPPAFRCAGRGAWLPDGRTGPTMTHSRSGRPYGPPALVGTLARAGCSLRCASGRTDTKRVGVLSKARPTPLRTRSVRAPFSGTLHQGQGPWIGPPSGIPLETSPHGNSHGKIPNTRGAERPPPVHTRGNTMERSIRVSRPRAWRTLESFHAVGFIARGWTPPGTRGGSAALRGALGSSRDGGISPGARRTHILRRRPGMGRSMCGRSSSPVDGIVRSFGSNTGPSGAYPGSGLDHE
jgi:hypothetical protein